MSSVYAPVAVKLPGGVTIPADGTDYVSASSVNVPLSATADGIKFCTDRKRTFFIPAADSGAALAGAVITSLTYVDVLGAPLLSIPTVAVGDWVNIWYTCHQYSTGNGMHKLALGPSHLDAYGGWAWSRTGYSQMSMFSRFQVVAGHLNAGTLDIYLYSKIETAGYVNPLQPHFMIAEVEKP